MKQLAINGGAKTRNLPFPTWPVARYDELERLYQVLETEDWGVLNPEVEKFAQLYSRYTGARYALPTSNGTVSLEVILRALGIGRGDEVIVPIYTFVATVSAITMVGATPVFADIRMDTHLLDSKSVEANITDKTRAVIAVHIGGRPCDMDAIREVADRHNLFVIEDAAQAHGAQWRDQKVGTMGIAGAFSFQASKNIPAGEGGIITTNDESLYKKMWSIQNYGRDYDQDIWYEHPHLGGNTGIGAWQAVILQEQMRDIDDLLEKRMKSARYLQEKLSEFDFLEFPPEDPRVTKNAYHLMMFRYLPEKLHGVSRQRFVQAMLAEGIDVISEGYSMPINTMKFMSSRAFYKATGTERTYEKIDTPNGSKIAYENGLWITQNALLENISGLNDIVAAVRKIAEHYDELL